MTKIKVNYTNIKNKRTSTTINLQIGIVYYQDCVPQAEKDYIAKFTETMHRSKAVIALRDKKIQEFVNNLVKEATREGNIYLDIDKSYIELRMLNEIRHANLNKN